MYYCFYVFILTHLVFNLYDDLIMYRISLNDGFTIYFREEPELNNAADINL